MSAREEATKVLYAHQEVTMMTPGIKRCTCAWESTTEAYALHLADVLLAWRAATR